MTPNLHRINMVLLVVKSDFVTNNVKLCCDSTRKDLKRYLNLCISLSRPAWDAWIEINLLNSSSSFSLSRPAWDAWIEIMNTPVGISILCRRVPHGTRGLKFLPVGNVGD